MKTGFLVVVVMLAVCLSAIGQISTPPASGTGTSGSPYQIATLDNLYWLSQTSAEWGKYFIQTADIDASSTSGWSGGVGFSPIGNTVTSFAGSYNGNGKIISGLTINISSAVENVGLFGITDNAAAITSLGLTGVSINSTNYNSWYFGGLVGTNSGTITNCYSTGSISTTYHLVGGLVGFLNGGTLTKCYSKVNVSISAASQLNYIGGLIGSSSGSITDCYATGNVVGGTSTLTKAGGLIGTNSLPVTNCYSSGNVTGSGTLGGLLGDNSGTITNSFWDTQTSGQASSAGGTGKTTAEMKTQSTFTGASWNFSTIWEMIGTNYPRLQIIPDAALPVELTSITAIASPNTVAIRWQTATEVNNNGFEIERRNIEGQMWAKVGFVSGSGTTSSRHEYSFADRNVSSGRYAYRIKQVNKDGSLKYTGEVEVEVDLAPKEFNLVQNYPNPFNPSTTIEFTLPEDGRAVLKVVDMLGREVATLFDGEAKAGYYNRVVFDASRLASGTYFTRLEASGKHILKKMILMK